MFYLGTSEQKIDARGRMNVPARFQDDLGERFVIFKSPDGCLCLYDNVEFEKLAAQAKQEDTTNYAARSQQRKFVLRAMNVEPDVQKRMTIDEKFREYAGISNKVVVFGNIDHVELWSPERFEAMQNEDTDMPPINF